MCLFYRLLALTTLAAVAGCEFQGFGEEPGRGVLTGIAVQDEVPLVVGEARARLFATYVDRYGNSVLPPSGLPPDVQWTSRDTSIVRLANGDSLFAGLQPGSTYVVARSGNYLDSARVTVTSDYRVWPNVMRLIPGGVRRVAVRAGSPPNGVRAVRQLEWESADPAVATVVSDGTITAMGEGVTTIIARRGAFTAASRVTVASYSRQLAFVDFAIGPRSICAVEADGSTWCWGHNVPVDGTAADRCEDWQGEQTCASSPTLMTTLPLTQVASAKDEFWVDESRADLGPYALAADGRFLRLGETGPVEVGGTVRFKWIWGGRLRCGVALDGKGYCWGVNYNGRMGNGTAQPIGPWSQTPTEVSGGLKWQMFARGESVCGLAEGGVAYCWGSNVNYGAGVGPVTTSGTGCQGPCVLVPTAVQTSARFTQLAGGMREVCGLTAETALYCWGEQLTYNGGPWLVSSATGYVALFGNVITCAVDAAGAAYCLPFPGEPPRPTYSFAKVPLPFPVKKIVTGYKAHCALSATDSRLYCWGTGALGRGIPTDTATAQNPVEVWGQRPPG